MCLTALADLRGDLEQLQFKEGEEGGKQLHVRDAAVAASASHSCSFSFSQRHKCVAAVCTVLGGGAAKQPLAIVFQASRAPLHTCCD